MSWHGYGIIKDQLFAYIRVRPLEDEIVIERVITSKAFRGRGIGK